jgi:hypothetical protein
MARTWSNVVSGASDDSFKDILKNALDEQKKEDTMQTERKLSIIIHRLAESTQVTREDRLKEDLDRTHKLIQSVEAEGIEIKNTFRLGTYDPDRPGARPLKVSFGSPNQQQKVMSNLRYLSRPMEDEYRF